MSLYISILICIYNMYHARVICCIVLTDVKYIFLILNNRNRMHINMKAHDVLDPCQTLREHYDNI